MIINEQYQVSKKIHTAEGMLRKTEKKNIAIYNEKILIDEHNKIKGKKDGSS